MSNVQSRDLHDYYTTRLAAGGVDAAGSVGWKNRQAQLNRFEQLIKIIDREKGFTVNDLGCGVGDFSEYLASRGFNDFKYYGYDIFDFMVDGGKKRYGSHPNRQFVKIAESNQMQVADYSVASGILNLKFTTPEDEWLDYVLKQLHSLNDKSSRGFAFNALTKYSDREFMKDELYYADPCFIFDYCKRKFSRNVALLHDYQEYDFTMIVRKF